MPNNLNDSFWEATGPIEFNPLNDIVFKLLLQSSEPALRGLVGALLHLRDEEIKTIEVINPQELGSMIQDKIFVLDVKVSLNDDTIIGLEMQVLNEDDWPDRSLSYLCRTFDNLRRGDDYTQAKAAYHIGFLDFTLFPDAEPEFYSTYKLCNIKTGHIYNDKFSLSVVNLRRIDLATEEDREWKIDEWATLFKATTWEELQMIAQTDPNIEKACKRIHVMNADEMEAEQELRRWFHERRQRRLQQELEAKDAEIIELKAAFDAEKVELVAAKDAEITELVAAKDAEIIELRAALAALQAQQEM